MLPAQLLDWYDKNARRLPWSYLPGETPDPYRVWLSEIMLQQTRVQAVLPYFETFVRKWPSVRDLAAAPQEEVLRTWARAGTPYDHWKEDFDGEALRVRLNPNFDPFLVSRYKDASEQAYRFRLSRARFDVDQWIDQRYLKAALNDLSLQSYWPIYQPNGKILGA